MGKERKFYDCSSFQPGKWIGSLLAEPGWGFAPLCHPSAEMCWLGQWAEQRDLGGSPAAAGLFLASEVFGPRHWVSLPGWFVLKSLLLLFQQNPG